MNTQKTTQETLLMLGIGAISGGIERMEVSLTLGISLVVTGLVLIYVRGALKP